MGILKSIALYGIGHNLNKLLKEKRLVFLNGNNVEYTNKQGVKKALTFDGMVDVFIESGGTQNVAAVGVTTDDIKSLITKAYQKEVK